MAADPPNPLPTRPPTPLARRFVRYLVGFGVAVGLGSAPFLGKIEVPGFDTLLRLLPRDLQSNVLPFSAFLMGVIAVAVQFYSGERIAKRTLERRFRLALFTLAGGLVLFIILHGLLVVAVPIGDEITRVTVSFSRVPPPACGCPAEMSDPDCLAEVSLAPGAVESCWGGGPVRLARLALSLTYLALTGGFAALIGLLLLRTERSKR